jgi:hypothetical protein
LLLFWSLGYLAFRCLLQFVLLRPRSEGFKELEIVVLRHELSVLRSSLDDARSPDAPLERPPRSNLCTASPTPGMRSTAA